LLHFQVGTHITIRRGNARMAQVITDDGDVDSGLEQRNGTTVPK